MRPIDLPKIESTEDQSAGIADGATGTQWHSVRGATDPQLPVANPPRPFVAGHGRPHGAASRTPARARTLAADAIGCSLSCRLAAGEVEDSEFVGS